MLNMIIALQCLVVIVLSMMHFFNLTNSLFEIGQAQVVLP